MIATVPVATRDDLSLAYTPGVAQHGTAVITLAGLTGGCKCCGRGRPEVRRGAAVTGEGA